MKYYVYLLECADLSFYIGVTNNIGRRFIEHQLGICKTSYTVDRRPTKLVYLEEFDYILNAIDREKQLKKWSHEKKKALIEGNFSKLRMLSKSKNSNK